MTKVAPKIEELLGQATQSVDFSAQGIREDEFDLNAPKISFPKILDFTFPDNDPEIKSKEIGEVTYIGDGVCQVTGLSLAKIDEVLSIKTDNGIEKALIFGIGIGSIEAVVLGDYANIKRGDQATVSSSHLSVLAGSKLLGRVVSPLGVPLDGLGKIDVKHVRSVEFPAPGVVDRVPVLEPLHTGIIAIDATIPIGKGQRELVIGDRKTGKSRTMIDIISNQAGAGVICIYVGVGTQAAKTKAALQLLTARNAMKYTTMIVSFSDDPPSLQYLAPYVGTAVAEYFREQGKDVLIVYDDLSKQAKAYRQVSLLLKRSPGRDAYPGDIFFLHSRLLERAAKMAPSQGGGSLTALPVAETQLGDISDYIVTNLMSITDGHIYLDANLMHEGILPAINSGASVSRIGGKVQLKLLQIAGDRASRILARYEEVKSFETINTEVTKETMLEIKRGKRIKEMFSQDSALNLSVLEEIVLLAIAVSARMDHLEVAEIRTFKQKFIPFLRQIDTKSLEAKIKSASKLEEIDAYLDKLFNSFTKKYRLQALPLQQVQK
jgi:F-type H+/Na+-transporting ATPase subunit alpha